MPRQEFVDPALLAAVDDGGESGGQIGKRIDGVELSGFDERAIVALFSAPTSCPAKRAFLPEAHRRRWPEKTAHSSSRSQAHHWRDCLQASGNYMGAVRGK